MIEELSVYDLPNRKTEPDGYDLKEVPDMSAANIAVLMDKINEVVRMVNKLEMDANPLLALAQNK